MPHSEHIATKKAVLWPPSFDALRQHNTTQCNIMQHTAHTFSSYAMASLIFNNNATQCNTLQHTATQCNTVDTPSRAVRRPPSSDALQHSATQCNTMQHNATQCNTVQHDATQCNTVQHNATQCNTVQHNATQWTHLLELCNGLSHLTHCNTAQHSATQCNTMQHNGHTFSSCAMASLI